MPSWAAGELAFTTSNGTVVRSVSCVTAKVRRSVVPVFCSGPDTPDDFVGTGVQDETDSDPKSLRPASRQAYVGEPLVLLGIPARAVLANPCMPRCAATMETS